MTGGEEDGLRRRLAAIVGGRAVSADPADLAPWLTDWRGAISGEALALVEPRTSAEVQEIVRLAGESGTPIVPQGGNTGMVAGGVPRPGERPILLSLRRMNAIRSVDVDDMSLVAEAGAILSNVHRAAEDAGCRFPLSLGAKESATIGGLLSTNAGGTQVLRFGTMRALTLGIEAVLPDASLFEGLTTLRKDNRGYDLRQLLIGAEGTLGIITAGSLRLYPAAPHRLAGWAGLDSPPDALALLRRLEAVAGEAVESFELIPADALELVLEHIPDTRAPLAGPHRWHALFELRTSGDPAPLRAALEGALAGALERRRIADATIAESEAQAEAMWKLRDTIAEAERIDGPSAKHDVSVPVAAMPRFIEAAAAEVESRFRGARVIAFGHLGDGNVHFNVRPPAAGEGAAWLREHGEAVSRFVHDLVREEGGSLSAEHGIGQLKIAEFARLADPARLAAMRAIKQALDPRAIMNPGKLVPLANPPETP